MRHHHAQARQRRLDRLRRAGEAQPSRRLQPGALRLHEPARPVADPRLGGDLQQRVARQVAGPCQRATLEQRRAERREAVVRHQEIRGEAGPAARSEADRQVDVGRRLGHRAQGGGEPHLDRRMPCVKAGQPGNQPARGQRRQQRHGQPAGAARGQHPLGAAADLGEGAGQRRGVVLAFRGEREAPPVAPHQAHAELALQPAQALGYRRLGDAQLLGRAGDAQMARDGFEGAQRGEGGRHRRDHNASL